MLKHANLKLSDNQASWKQVESVAPVPAVTSKRTGIKKRKQAMTEETRRIWKIILVANLTWILFACGFWQFAAFVSAHSETAERMMKIPGPVLTVTLSFFVIGYWCYLIARNLTDFVIGQGPKAKALIKTL